MNLVCSLTEMDSPCKACSNEAHCTGTHLTQSLAVKYFFIFMQKISFYGFWCAFSEAGIVVIASPSCLFHLNCIYVYMYGRQTEKFPSSFFLPFAPFSFSFESHRNTEDALLLHHNHSGMTIQCPAILEQNGNWVKTSSRIHWPLQISTSQSMSPSGNCLSPQKCFVINWQILTVSNSRRYYSRAINFIFIWCIEKIIRYTSACTNTVTWHPSAFKA